MIQLKALVTGIHVAYQNEIQEIMTRELTEEDEADIMNQLDELIAMETDAKVLELNLSNAPTQTPIVEATTKEPSKVKNKGKQLVAA